MTNPLQWRKPWVLRCPTSTQRMCIRPLQALSLRGLVTPPLWGCVRLCAAAVSVCVISAQLFATPSLAAQTIDTDSVTDGQNLIRVPSAPRSENQHVELTNLAAMSCLAMQDDSVFWPDNAAQPNTNSVQEASVVTEPYTNPRGQPGSITTASTEAGTDIVWTTISSAGAISAVQIETSFESLPTDQWVLDANCQALQHRHIKYSADSIADAIHVLDTATGTLRNVEALNPPLPVMQTDSDEDAIRVALVDSGVNYTLPEINQRLARDEQGDIIGYDFWDNDALPFDSHFSRSRFHVTRHGTGTASLLLNEAPFVELVPYRYPRPDMNRMRALIEHAVQNNVRIIGLPLGGNRKEQWEAFEQAASEHEDILFVASAGNNGRNIDQQPVYPAALPLDNLIVVTSTNDFVVPAERVNWGRTHVDYMLDAEEQPILDYFGRESTGSGSSYAVPRVVAMAARWLQQNPDWTAKELVSEFSRRFADGASARYVGGGYIADPYADGDLEIQLLGVQTLPKQTSENKETETSPVQLPLSVFVLNDAWSVDAVTNNLLEAERILSQCNIHFNSVTISQLALPEYLQDLKTGPARTLVSALNNDSEFKPIRVFFARDTKMLDAYDGEAFGRANTRRRPWLQDSVWLMHGVQDAGIALAHELFHVLSNSGEHNRIKDNLMQARTSENNTTLEALQCDAAISVGKRNSLLFD